MTEVKILSIYSHFLGEFTVNFNDSYSPMCESSIKSRDHGVEDYVFCCFVIFRV